MDNFTNEKTYDSVFWTGVVRLTRHLVPLVNEVFNEHYSDRTEIRLDPMKQVTGLPDHSLKETETDAIVEFRDAGSVLAKYYHFECQTWPDSGMALRIAEYDAGTAFSNVVQTENGARMTIPNSAVIFLRDSASRPNKYGITIDYPGGSVQYAVPVVRMSGYTLENLLEKHLYLLLPFYWFSYVKDLEKAERAEDILQRIRSDWQSINQCMADACKNGEIDVAEIRYLSDLIERVLERLTVKTETISKGVKEIMSIKILELETDRRLKKSHDQGELDRLISLVVKKVNREKELSVIIDELESNEDEIRPIYEAVLQYGVDTPPAEIREKMESREAGQENGAASE